MQNSHQLFLLIKSIQFLQNDLKIKIKQVKELKHNF